MTIKLEVDGKQYDQFNTANVRMRLDALTDTFGFDATSSEDKPLPFKGGEECKIYVDGEKVLTGSIEIVSINYSGRDHRIRIEGRDKTGDLLDSSLDSISSLSGNGLTLANLIKKVVSELGVDVKVIDNLRPEPFNAAEDIGSPQPGDNAFDFIEKFTRKRQAIITSNGDGDIVINSAKGSNVNANIHNVIGSEFNNVIQGSVDYDTTGRFNVYKFASALNVAALNFAGKIDIADVVSQKSSPVTDRDIREGRQLVLISEGSFSSAQNTPRAEWEKQIRKARGRVYSVTVHGYRNQTGNLWQLNTMPTIDDDFTDIHGRMLINSVDFSFGLDTGTQTVLTMVEPNAYTLQISEPTTEKLGDAFFG